MKTRVCSEYYSECPKTKIKFARTYTRKKKMRECNFHLRSEFGNVLYKNLFEKKNEYRPKRKANEMI